MRAPSGESNETTRLIGHRYRFVRQLGVGGLGETLEVEDVLVGKRVALKRVLIPSRAELLHREVGFLRGLWHPHLARALDVGRDGDRAFMTTELIVGESWNAWHPRREKAAVLRAAVDVLDALRALHAMGLRHGDVKPDNVLVGDRAVLIDFSCAARIDAIDPPPMGTPGYMAPELVDHQLRQQDRVDGRADLFGVGQLLATCDITWPSSTQRLIDRLCAHDPAERPSDAAEALEQLDPQRRAMPTISRSPVSVVGRRDALEAGHAFIEALDASQGARVLRILGPRGIGATRVLDELKWQAQLRHNVFVGFGDLRDDAVFELIGRAAQTRVEHVGEALDAIDRMHAGPHPTMLFLDDAHALDERQRAVLQAVLRHIPDGGRLAVVVRDVPDDESTPGKADDTAASRTLVIHLAPLNATAVAEWLGDRPELSLEAVMRSTGGYPRALSCFIDGNVEGATSPSLAELSPEGRRQLLTWSLVAPPGVLTEEELDTNVVAELVRAGWVAIEHPRVRLLRPREQLVKHARRHELEHAARTLERRASTEDEGARIVELWLAAGHADEARTSFINARRAWLRSPSRWLAVAQRLGPALPLDVSELMVEAGAWGEALSLLASARRRMTRAEVTRVAFIAAGAYLAAGRLRAAQRQIERALKRDAAAPHHDRAARIALRAGDFAGAKRHAQQGLQQCPKRDVEANLLDDLGTAESYLGNYAAARAHLAAAGVIHQESARPRSRARSLCYEGIAAFRSGHPEDAATLFARASDVAARANATDLWVYAAQNEGTARHQQGDLSAALKAYESGLRVAGAGAHDGAKLPIAANLAKLYVDAGAFERAVQLAARAERDAVASDALPLAVAAAATESDAHRFAGDLAAATNALDRAHAHLGDAEAGLRERFELRLQRAEIGLDDQQLADAEAIVAELRASVRDPSRDTEDFPTDLQARLCLLEGRISTRRGRAVDAIPILEEAQRLAQASAMRPLMAEVRVFLAGALDATGARLLARRHRDEARVIWERAAATLAPAWQQTFWAHPHRTASQAGPPSSHAPVSIQPRTMSHEAIRRLLAINQKLNASLDVKQILDWTIDNALELTGAERGFVLLGSDAHALEVAAARNVDAGAKDDFAFSRSIAERVLASGEPVVSVDAGRDDRFADHASVHAIRLLSVIAVPIRARVGIIGVVVLDHRFRRQRFDDVALELLTAMSDQVAIAVTNARLVQTLEERNRELDAMVGGQKRELRRLHREVREQRAALSRRFDFSSMIGESPALQRVFDVLDSVVDTDLPVLIQGESGTGKELVARALHHQSPRKKAPMVSVNCGALSETLLSSELFGYRRGAFTGADTNRDGLFVAARGGTLFLDELGEMPLTMQVKLLRVVQEKEVTPIGATRAVPVDVRVVAATNRDLEKEVAAGRFREDLFYRLGVVKVVLPPLRERREDIPLLAAHLLDRAAQRIKRAAPRVTEAAMRALQRHPWRGNVRELENVLTQAMVLGRGEAIDVVDLSLAGAPVQGSSDDVPEKQALLEALRHHRWNITKTAAALGVSRPTLYRRMDKHGLRE